MCPLYAYYISIFGSLHPMNSPENLCNTLQGAFEGSQRTRAFGTSVSGVSGCGFSSHFFVQKMEVILGKLE
jgi:hypothetical protein